MFGEKKLPLVESIKKATSDVTNKELRVYQRVNDEHRPKRNANLRNQYRSKSNANLVFLALLSLIIDELRVSLVCPLITLLCRHFDSHNLFVTA